MVVCRGLKQHERLQCAVQEQTARAYINADATYTSSFHGMLVQAGSQSSSSSQVFLEWPKQQRHHEDHYSQDKYEQYQIVL